MNKRLIEFILVFVQFTQTQPSEVKLQTRLGHLTGNQIPIILNNEDIGPINVFFDIPYGKAPVGPLRFQKSQPYGSWGDIQARFNNKLCWLGIKIPELERYISQSEDCLHLNIYVPHPVSAANQKAVLVIIPGGSYVIGSKIFVNGQWLSKLGDVIVVVPNYRLGEYQPLLYI